MTEFTDISEEEMLRELEAMGFTDSTTADPTTTPISEGEVKDNTDTNMWAYGPDGEKMRMNGEFFNNPDKPNNPKIQEDIVKALAAMNFEHVSRTQHSVLPVVLAHFDPTKGPNEQAPGNHCIIQGPAGTGKTMAFILGTMSQIDRKLKTPQVIVIADTQELAEQNQQQADFFAWESEEVGNQIKYKLKGDQKISRFGDSPDQEIHTGKLVGGMSPPWEQRLGQGGRMNPTFKAQYVSVTKGILENLLKKKDGKYTPLTCEFLKDVRMVVIDEADKLWSNGGIQGLEKNFLVPICAARNQGKKANTKKARENLVKTQFIFVSATFVPSDRTPLRDACANLKKKGYGMELKEVYLSNKDLLLKKVKQFYIPCENYQSQYTALYNICQSIKNVSKSILIIPMGEEVVNDDKSGKRRAIGQNDEMDRIYDYLTQHETPLELVDRFSATRMATDSEKNDRNVRKNKRGRVKYTEAERVKKMEAFKRQEIKHMIATSMDRGVNVKACTHVILFGMATKSYDNDKIENEYLQRIGRCGRAGQPGCAIVLINRPDELGCLKQVETDLDMAKESMGIRRAFGWADEDARIGQINQINQRYPENITDKDGNPSSLDGNTKDDTNEWWGENFCVHTNQ